MSPHVLADQGKKYIDFTKYGITASIKFVIEPADGTKDADLIKNS